MELLDKGKHCQEEFCHQIDFLPMQCKACKKHFCSSHFAYDSHRCAEAAKFNFKVPICEICSQPIEFKRGRDLDLCLAEHMLKCMQIHGEETQATPTVTEKQPKAKSKKCNHDGCKSKDNVMKFECESCGRVYCVKHRIPEDHKCSRMQLNAANSCSSQFRNSSAKYKKDNNVNYFTASSF